MQLKQMVQAEQHLRRAAALDPESWDFQKDLGACIEARKGVNEAIRHFRRVILSCRTNPDMYVILAGQLLAKAAPLAALDACEAALRLDGRYVHGWLERCRSLTQLRMFNAAGASLAMARHLHFGCDTGETPEWAKPYSFWWTAPPRTPRKGAMRAAVCMTGHCQALEFTIHNLQTNVLDPLGNPDIFIYAVDDEHSILAERLNPTMLVTKRDDNVDEQAFRPHWSAARPLQGYLQHLRSLQRVNQMREDHGETYDAVVFVRPDGWFLRPIPNLATLDLSMVHVPHQDLKDGINDRFAIGSTQDMSAYLSRYETLMKSPQLAARSPENFLMHHLVSSNVMPTLNPAVEARVARVVHGRMMLDPIDWLVHGPRAARAIAQQQA